MNSVCKTNDSIFLLSDLRFLCSIVATLVVFSLANSCF